MAKNKKESELNRITSKEIATLTEAFIAKGGKIKQCPTRYADGAYRAGIISSNTTKK